MGTGLEESVPEQSTWLSKSEARTAYVAMQPPPMVLEMETMKPQTQITSVPVPLATITSFN